MALYHILIHSFAVVHGLNKHIVLNGAEFGEIDAVEPKSPCNIQEA
jgi:hypothetical protein